ncbi:MAG: hypothetical protein ACLUEQ_05305 [Cloacibacillus evryensis]
MILEHYTQMKNIMINLSEAPAASIRKDKERDRKVPPAIKAGGTLTLKQRKSSIITTIK